MRSALLLEYLGAAYRGSQSQAHGNTIQDAVQAALRKLGLEPKSVTMAGRTDAGVNAHGQVLSFDLDGDAPCSNIPDFRLALNTFLPADIRLKQAALGISERFHPRKDARLKWYRYQIMSSPGASRSPFCPPDTAWTRQPLDADAMAEAARLIEGEHDFKSFKNNYSYAINIPSDAVCHILHARIHKKVLPEGDLVILDIVSNRFLYKMVRNLMGQLLAIGADPAQKPEAILKVMERQDRRCCAPAAKPEGLSLMAVHYPPELNLFPEDPYVQLLNAFTLKQKDNPQDEYNIFRKAS